ncbi:MAG: Fic family protein [Acidobacteriota bacterium]
MESYLNTVDNCIEGAYYHWWRQLRTVYDMLFKTPELTEDELQVVDKIEDIKRELGHAVSAPKRWFGLIRRATFARAIRASNTIEGFEVSPDDAIAAVEREEPLDSKAEAWAAVNCYRSAMTYVLQLADAPAFTYSLDILSSLHFMMLEYDLTKHPGRWRIGPIFVSDEEKKEDVYEGPPAELLSELMSELVASLNNNNRSVPSVVAAAMAHLNFVMIHPHSDGNGRMARCLHTLVLARTGILAPVFSSIEEYLGRNTRQYYDVLLQVGGGTWRPERDARPWIRFCLKAHYQQARTVQNRLREMQILWDLLEKQIAEHGLPERVIYALADAANGYRVRNAIYRPAAEITNQIASRDFKVLVEHGFLTPVGEKRGRSYRASPELLALRGGIRLPRKIEDPFQLITGTPYLPGLGPTV